MPIILTPNMNLPVPVVGQELGPQYATDVNNCLITLDLHNHTSGYGVQIPSGGLNINSDLTFLNSRATNLKAATFSVQGSPLTPSAPDLGAIYVSGQDLYYNDTIGNQIQITLNGNVNAGAGNITGLVAPASASYVVGNTTFVWQSNVNTSAAMDNGPITIREEVANAKGITLNSPAALPVDYSLTFPSGLPVSPQVVSVDPSGNLSFATPSPLSELGTKTTYSVAGTYMYVVPSGITYVRVLGCGGGGGGSGAFGVIGGGGGGGAGIFEGTLSVVPGETLTVVVGAGGAGSTTNAANPNIASNGGNSSITGSTSGALLTMFGAQGGQGGSGGGGSFGTGEFAGGNGSAPILPPGSGGNSYVFSRQSGSGGSGAGAQGAGGGGSIGAGGTKGIFTPLTHPTTGGAGAGGGGQDGTAGYVDTGGSGGDGQVTIFVQ